MPPPATLDGDVRAADWLGLAWREAVAEPPGRGDVGAYRIGRSEQDGNRALDYAGQGLIAARWKSHASAWALDLAAEDGGDSVWDWAGLTLGPRQLLEVENDLIAGHVHVFTRPPAQQFGAGTQTSPG